MTHHHANPQRVCRDRHAKQADGRTGGRADGIQHARTSFSPRTTCATDQPTDTDSSHVPKPPQATHPDRERNRREEFECLPKFHPDERLDTVVPGPPHPGPHTPTHLSRREMPHGDYYHPHLPVYLARARTCRPACTDRIVLGQYWGSIRVPANQHRTEARHLPLDVLRAAAIRRGRAACGARHLSIHRVPFVCVPRVCISCPRVSQGGWVEAACAARTHTRV